MTVKANKDLQAIFDAAVRAEETAENLFRQKTPDSPSLNECPSYEIEDPAPFRPRMSEAFLSKLQQGPLRSRTNS